MNLKGFKSKARAGGTMYPGNRDLDTANLIAPKAGKTRETVFASPRNTAYFMEYGGKYCMVDKVSPFMRKPSEDAERKQSQAVQNNTDNFQK